MSTDQNEVCFRKSYRIKVNPHKGFLKIAREKLKNEASIGGYEEKQVEKLIKHVRRRSSTLKIDLDVPMSTKSSKSQASPHSSYSPSFSSFISKPIGDF